MAISRIATGLLLLTNLQGCKAKLKSQENCSHSKTQLSCVTYKGNYDGDTITVEIPKVHQLFGDKISVRIRGIDTPELKSSSACERVAAKKAKSYVQYILENAKRIDLKNTKRGKYFRVVADVIADETNLGKRLLQNNLAVIYDGQKKNRVDWCEMRPRISVVHKEDSWLDSVLEWML